MKTKKTFSYVWKVITLSILSSPLAVLSPAEALPPGVPEQPCGTLANPHPGSLCYDVTPGGGKVNAGAAAKSFTTIIQAMDPQYVIASVVVEVTSEAGDRDRPTVNQISPGGTASVVSVATDKLRELKQMKGELEAKAKVLAGPALIEAQQKLSALSEQERSYEKIVTTTTEAGKDAGKFQVNSSARSRDCGWGNLDTCGSWIEYNIYAVKRYVGNPIAAYNRAFAVAQDAQVTINRLITESKQVNNPACSSSYDPKPYRPGTSGWTGRVGQIAFNNGTSNSVQVRLYHPDAPDRAFNSWNVQPGQNVFLGGDNYGMDWGIQVDSSPTCIVGSVSDWTSFNGGQFFQTRVERIRR